MIGLGRSAIVSLGILALASVAPAGAQENLDVGKSPAQLYAADCAICHKSPQGMTKNSGLFGLSNFLREHYTASRESAAAIAAYVESIDRGPAPAAKHPPRKRSAKGDEKGKEKDKPGKPAEAKSDEPKSAAPKAVEAKPDAAKAGEAKPVDGKPAVVKPKPAKDEKSEKKPD
jgi:hypothetical protein